MEIKLDLTQIDELQKELQDFAQKPLMEAFRRSLKRSLDSGSLIAYRLYADQYNASVSKLKAAKVIQGKFTEGDGKTVNSVSAGIIFSKKQLSVTAFNARQNKRGVRWGVSQFVQSGFKAPTGFSADKQGNIASDSYTFFKRTGSFSIPTRGSYAGRVVSRGKNKGKLMLRERLRKLVGYSASVVLGERDSVRNEVVSQVVSQFDKEFSGNFTFYLERALGRAQSRLSK